MNLFWTRTPCIYYAECHYGESCYTECHYGESYNTECHYGESCYTECHYGESCYTECHYVECHGTSLGNTGFLKTIFSLLFLVTKNAAPKNIFIGFEII